MAGHEVARVFSLNVTERIYDNLRNVRKTSIQPDRIRKSKEYVFNKERTMRFHCNGLPRQFNFERANRFSSPLPTGQNNCLANFRTYVTQMKTFVELNVIWTTRINSHRNF